MELELVGDPANHIFLTNIRPGVGSSTVTADWVRKGHRMGEFIHSGRDHLILMSQWYVLMPEKSKEFTDEEYESLLV